MSEGIGKAMEIPTAPLGLFEGLSSTTVKQLLDCGTLLSSLRKAYKKSDGAFVLTGIRLGKKEQYRVDSTFLNLWLEFQNAVDMTTFQRELVLQFPLQVGEHARFWFYPEDPDLPSLSKLAHCKRFLLESSWKHSWEGIFDPGENPSLKRLSYDPRVRGTNLLRSENSEQGMIVKVLGPRAFGETLKIHRAVLTSHLHRAISFPTLISYAISENAFLFGFLPGKNIGKLSPSVLSQIKRPLFEEVVRIMSEIHTTRIALPQWTPKLDIETMRRYVNYIEARRVSLSPLICKIFEMFCERFHKTNGPYVTMIHNDFSEKNILYDDGQAGAFAPRKLSIIDWDNATLGPREKDIGVFLSKLYPERGDRLFFLDLYRERTGCAIDLDLLNSFLLFRPFMRTCKEILVGTGTEGAHSESLLKIWDRLEHNHLRASCVES